MEFIYLIMLPALTGGLVQGVTGFGSGIVMMLILPIQFGVTKGAGISSAICIVLSLSMAYRYRKTVDYKKIIIPSLIYLTASIVSIYYSTMVNQEVMKLIFGLFLIFLAVYFLGIAKETVIEPTRWISIFCVVVSGICDGLFGIGGPLMVIYFLSKTRSTKEYLGTIQSFFFVNGVYTTIFRIYNHTLTIDLLPAIFLGMITIVVGLKIANQCIDRLDREIIKKLTYILIGICGVINVLTVWL